MNTEGFEWLRGLVRDRTAVALDTSQMGGLELRLEPIVRDAGAASIDDFVSSLRHSPFGDLHRRAIEAALTHETSFFRDIAVFQSLRDAVLPALLEARTAERSLRIWSAACATGQEPYSIAMQIADLSAARVWDVSILATDISCAAIETARAGRYTQLEVNRGLPAALLVRHFRRTGAWWEVSEAIRAGVTFETLNLAGPWPSLPPMDVVLLRNVLIYFDVETKKQVLAKVARALRTDGCLILGGVETPVNLDSAFEPVDSARPCIYRLRRT